MHDWIDRLIAEAEHQGFIVRQHADGSWRFQLAERTFISPPLESTGDLVTLIDVLREMGLVLTDDHNS